MQHAIVCFLHYSKEQLEVELFHTKMQDKKHIKKDQSQPYNMISPYLSIRVSDSDKHVLRITYTNKA
jgi:hypothetical protein